MIQAMTKNITAVQARASRSQSDRPRSGQLVRLVEDHEAREPGQITVTWRGPQACRIGHGNRTTRTRSKRSNTERAHRAPHQEASHPAPNPRKQATSTRFLRYEKTRTSDDTQRMRAILEQKAQEPRSSDEDGGTDTPLRRGGGGHGQHARETITRLTNALRRDREPSRSPSRRRSTSVLCAFASTKASCSACRRRPFQTLDRRNGLALHRATRVRRARAARRRSDGAPHWPSPHPYLFLIPRIMRLLRVE